MSSNGYFSGTSRSKTTASIVNANQGGGERKAGSANTVGRSENISKQPMANRVNDKMISRGRNSTDTTYNPRIVGMTFTLPGQRR